MSYKNYHYNHNLKVRKKFLVSSVVLQVDINLILIFIRKHKHSHQRLCFKNLDHFRCPLLEFMFMFSTVSINRSKYMIHAQCKHFEYRLAEILMLAKHESSIAKEILKHGNKSIKKNQENI